ncbi:hypothetical protein [Zhenhengia yiwuensis]|uniref:Uncharacterized protein n=1 Tax=Zhenhengia yiwuensis TaxID=2763666 RepID=A0A926IGD4_9FIRM|nr:hypothetical protein [Zhenhengia yiwuensis]MBC8581436.1 hypothetical protein [Zhenhengia yiwuensis]
MKKVVIKRLNLKKVFYGCIAATIIPAEIIGIIGIIIALNSSAHGIVFVNSFITMISPAFYGIIGVIIALGYNLVSPFIGQFEMDVELTNEENR